MCKEINTYYGATGDLNKLFLIQPVFPELLVEICILDNNSMSYHILLQIISRLRNTFISLEMLWCSNKDPKQMCLSRRVGSQQHQVAFFVSLESNKLRCLSFVKTASY